MKTTIRIKLIPDSQQEYCLKQTGLEYISLVNHIVDYALGQGKMPRLSSARVNAALPSALKNQVIRDANSVYRKSLKTHIQPVLKKPVIIWNNQNYTVSENCVSVPLLVNGKTQRMHFRAVTTPEILEKLSTHELGTLRISRKNKKWVAQVAIEQPCAENAEGPVVMGVDLNLKCPAVAVTNTGKVVTGGRPSRAQVEAAIAEQTETPPDRVEDRIREQL